MNSRWWFLPGILVLMVMVFLAGDVMSADVLAMQQRTNLEVVVRGLNNPRGITFAADGKHLLVAEAGSGGSGTCFEGAEGLTCLGNTGAISRINPATGAIERIVTGLPSLARAEPPGSNATGIHDLTVIDDDEFYVVMGLGGNPATRAAFGREAALLGHIVRVQVGGTIQPLADLAAFEAANDVDGGGVDSNPYAIAARADRLFVVDAGANTLTAVNYDGTMQVSVMLPDRLVPAPPFINPPPPGGQIPMESVPVSTAVGPDGAIYVGQLTGFPFQVGAANVYRIGANGEAVVYASGFTNIIDIGFDKQGNLYVLEMARNSLLRRDEPPAGRLVRVAQDKSQVVLASDGLIAPTGLLIADDAIYISNFGVIPGGGQLVRIRR